MKIGLISDTHGSAKTFDEVLSGPFRDVEMILHAGDVLYHGARNPLTDGYDTMALTDRINNLKIPFMVAKGNCDSEVDRLVLNSPMASPYLFLTVEGVKIMVLHGHNRDDGDLERLISQFGLHCLVHGHSHMARLRYVGKSVIVNPGTPTIPHRSSPFNKTVGLLDTSTHKVVVCDVETMKTHLEATFEP